MPINKKYQLCVSLQQRVIMELKKEFSVSKSDIQFPSCITYENGEYTYDLDSIRIIYFYYFKENIIALQSAKNVSGENFVGEIARRMIHVIENIVSIHNEYKFRKEFHKKAIEIQKKYFDNPDEKSKYNLRIKIHEYNCILNDNDIDIDEFDEEDFYETFNDILKDFKEDMRKLKEIRTNYPKV